VTEISTSSAAGALMTATIIVAMCGAHTSAAEICHYTGSADYDGHVMVTSDVTASGGITRVDVAGVFDATTMLWFRIHYLLEEVSTWRDGELQSVSMNSRYLFGDHIVRQTWDDFHRGRDGLEAYGSVTPRAVAYRRGWQHGTAFSRIAAGRGPRSRFRWIAWVVARRR
jgi:hypothetical protein